MNDSINVKAQCPYFLRHSMMRVSWGIAHEIVCEPICSTERLGFDAEQSVKLKSANEFREYTGIFCCDMYDTCPVYKAILQSREEEDAKKHNQTKTRKV